MHANGVASRAALEVSLAWVSGLPLGSPLTLLTLAALIVPHSLFEGSVRDWQAPEKYGED
jgi:hypothetical protein